MSTDAGPSRQPCRHLGLLADRNGRYDFPSLEHRCHLWDQREQIDLTHQRGYCLTPAHRQCPWLSVPPPGQRSADRRLPHRKLALSGSLVASLCVLIVLLLNGSVSTEGFSLDFLLGHSPAAGKTLAALSPAAPLDAASPVALVAAAAAPGPRVLPAGSLTPAVLAAEKPQSISAKLSAATGGTVVAGNVGLNFSPESLAEAGGQVTVNVDAQPAAGVPGGPAQFSPNGTIVDVTVHDAGDKLVTTFPQPVDVLFKYNSADLAMSKGDPSVLTAAYVLDADSPALENPLHFPINTWIFFPPSNTTLDVGSGTIAVRTQAIGSIFSVVSAPISYAQTLRDIQLYSSFDPASSQVFGTKKQFSYLRVVEPQIGSRLLVREPETGNYAYVNAKDVGPSGPPPTNVKFPR